LLPDRAPARLRIKRRAWLAELDLPADERQAVAAVLRQLDVQAGLAYLGRTFWVVSFAPTPPARIYVLVSMPPTAAG
jgi:hypothetical protein